MLISKQLQFKDSCKGRNYASSFYQPLNKKKCPALNYVSDLIVVESASAQIQDIFLDVSLQSGRRLRPCDSHAASISTYIFVLLSQASLLSSFPLLYIHLYYVLLSFSPFSEHIITSCGQCTSSRSFLELARHYFVQVQGLADVSGV